MCKNSFIFSNKITNLIKIWENKYPVNKKRSVIIPALHILQNEYGYLNHNLIKNLSAYLSVPIIQIYEVVTFYSMFNLKPIGKHKLNLCMGISCILNNAKVILKYIEKKLKIKNFETTKDNRFTLNTVECLGACCNAPALLVNKVYYENLSTEKIDCIINILKTES